MLRLKNKSAKYILFVFVIIFSLLSQKAFALQQLRNSNFTNGTTNWTTLTSVSGNRATNINGQTNNLIINAENSNNQNYTYDGMVYQSFRTPASAINVRFSWGAWSASSADNGGGQRTYDNINYWIGYGNGTGANTTGGSTFSSTSSDGNFEAGTLNVNNINANTPFYAKFYTNARLRHKNYSVHFSSLEVNFSPSGLAANYNTTNSTIDGTPFTFIHGIQLSWNTSSSDAIALSKYNIYRSTTSGSGFVKIGQVAAGTTSYLDTPDTAGTYYYVVTDVDTNGIESPFSKEVSITMPGKITGLSATEVTEWGNTIVSLNCNPAPNNSDIFFFRGTSSGNYDHKVSWGSTTPLNDDTFSDDTIYYYTAGYVFDYNGGGGSRRISPLCEEIVFYYLIPPNGLEAQYNYDFSNLKDRIRLNWNAKVADNLQKYTIYRSLTENGDYDEIGSVDAPATTFYDNTVIPGTTYYYKITCTTIKGESGFSQAANGHASKSPTNLTANVQTPTSVVLTWTAPDPANTNHNGYYIYRGLTDKGPFTQVGQIWSGETYTDNSVTIENGDCFFYVVADFNYQNEVISGYSNVAAATKLFPPSNLTATTSNGNAVLNWDASTCPAAKLGGYNIYRSDSSGSDYTKLGSVAKNVLTYTDSTVEDGRTYYYVVTAFNNNNGESDYSNEDDITIPASFNLTVNFDNSIVPQLVLTESDIANVKVNWAFSNLLPSINVTGYKISIIDENNNVVRSVTINANQSTTTYTVNNVLLRNNITYRSSVEVFYSIGGSSRNYLFYSSNQFRAVTPQTIAVRDGWSGKDIAYSFFENRVEANWDHDSAASIVRYEAAVGTTPYGNEIVDWHNIGLPSRIAINTPTLASGTIYYTSIRGINQVGNHVVKGCSDGFIARRDPASADTNAFEFFNNARVLENLSTDNGRLTPSGEIGGSCWHYCKPITITEPGIVDRINAPCLISFTPNPAPANVREFRVYDDQGNECKRYNLSNTTTAPQIVFLVNIKKGETKTYNVYWGNNAATDPNYGFVFNTDDTSLIAWTPYYTRINIPAGLEEDVGFTKFTSVNGGNITDDGYFRTTINKFKYFNTSYDNAYIYVGTNGYANFVNGQTTYNNQFNTFKNSWRTLAILWCDLYFGTSDMVNAGVYHKYVDTNPKRRIFMWKSHRYSAHDDRYILQEVLYETGDIKFIYNFIGYRSLYEGSSVDNPIVAKQGNKGVQHTSGISFGNSNWYLTNWKDLVSDAYDVTPTVFYQCLNAFEETTDYSHPVISDYKIAHFESMIFDTKLAAPTWNSITYKASLGANCSIDFYYRTGSTPLPEQGGWSDWSSVTHLESTNNGNIDLRASNPQGRYIQYKAIFKRSSGNAEMYIDEVRFVYGGISIEKVRAVNELGELITEVSQGEENIPVEVTIKNNCNETLSLNPCDLTFSLAGHTASIVDGSVLINILPGKSIVATFSVNIANDAPSGLCTIDAYASATPSIYDEDSQITHQWTVKSKSSLVIDNVYSEYTKVTKGFTYDLYYTITNTGESDCVINSITPTYTTGIYTFTIAPRAGSEDLTIGATIRGGETKIARYSVFVSSDSSSGSDTLAAIINATNNLSGETVIVSDSENPHTWTIQTPAALTLYEIVASSTLYRGQKNNNIILFATNEGEAELEWYPASSTEHINFTTITGNDKSYENKRMVSEDLVVNLPGEAFGKAIYNVDIKQDTATGTDQINATIKGKEINTQTELQGGGSIPSTEWTIYAEKVNTYYDGAYTEESDSFNIPLSGEITVYAKVDNLAANVEYLVHWYDPNGTEIEVTQPIITTNAGYFGIIHSFNNSSLSGKYTIKITDPLSLFICCENSFELVAPAEMTASFTMPLYATVDQPIAASFTFINIGGAIITNASLIPTDTVNISGTGNVTFTPDNPLEAIFSPRLSEVPGFGQATATFKLRASRRGNVSLTTSAVGYDKNSGNLLSVPNVTSNICTIQDPPNVVINSFVTSSNRVYLNEKNIRATAVIRNNGEATAVINSASITFNIGTYEQELMRYPEPLEIEIPQNSSITLTFDISVDASSATGNDTLTLKVKWYDKNWPVDKIVSSTANWTIMTAGIKLSSDPSFRFEQSDFCSGQTVYIKVFGLTPNSVSRVRYYNSMVDKDGNGRAPSSPTPIPIGRGGISGPLRANDNGEFGFNYELIYPSPVTVGTWTVTVETSQPSYSTYGTLLTLQYFRVQNTPHMVASLTIDNLSIENNDTIFEGDTFKVKLTLTSTTGDNSLTLANNTAAIHLIEPYTLIKDSTSSGNAELVSGPDIATLTLRAGESKTFEYIFKATENSGNSVFRLKSIDNNYIAKGRNINLWDHYDESEYDVFASHQLTSNGIVIYSKSMSIDPSVLEFETMDPLTEDNRLGLACGKSGNVNLSVLKTGNTNLDNIKLQKAALNGPIVNAVKQTISSTRFDVDVDSLPNPITTNSANTVATLEIPYNQPSGEYTGNMFLYCDSNSNNIFDTNEVLATFKVKVWVNLCKVIKVVNNVVEMGSWVRNSNTGNFTVNYFCAGNVALENVKITGVGSLTPYIIFSNPINGNVGAMNVAEYKQAIFNASITDGADYGTYIATYTIFEDKNGNGSFDPAIEPSDTFELHLTIGGINFTVKNATNDSSLIEALGIEPSTTYRSGVNPAGFDQLKITNTSTAGMALTRIKMKVDEIPGLGMLATESVDIFPGTLMEKIESGQNDIFDIEVYVKPGCPTGNYATILHFYSDDNGNDIIDPWESSCDVNLNIYVKPTEKVKVIDRPVSVTGMSSDIANTYAECEFLCYNLGNCDLRHLKFESQNLVQKDVQNPVEIPASNIVFSFVGSTPFVAGFGQEFSSKVTILVPRNTPDGVYVTTAFCKLYNDNGGDPDNEVESNSYTPGECYDEFQIWLQIGEMKLKIVNPHNITGAPSERSTEGVFTVKNDGALAISSVIATASELVGPGGTIPASCSIFLPSEKVGNLKKGFEKDLRWAVDISESMLAGEYTGTITAWSDTNGNNMLDTGEAYTTENVKLTIEAVPKLSIRKDDPTNPIDITTLEMPAISQNQSISQTIRLYNTGNLNLTNNILCNKSDLINLSATIGASNISMQIDNKIPLLPGEFVIATVTISLDNTLLNSGHYQGIQEFYVGNICSDTINLDIEFARKELILSPNPLDLGIVEEGLSAPIPVMASRHTNATLFHLCAYQKSSCDCGQHNCSETTISMLTEQGLPLTTPREFNFQINVDSTTAAGEHIATWTFFDDDDGDMLYDEGEYFVDLPIRYYVKEAPHLVIHEPATLTPILEIGRGETFVIPYLVENTGNTNIELSDCVWSLPPAHLIGRSDPGLSFDVEYSLVPPPAGTLAMGETATYTVLITVPLNTELDTYDYNGSPLTQTILYNGIIGSGDFTTIEAIKVIRRGPIVPEMGSTLYQSIASDTFAECSAVNPQTYFVSAWVCPGIADVANPSAANLSIVRCDALGRPKAAISIRIDNNNLEIQNSSGSFSLFYGKYDGVYDDIGQTSTFAFETDAAGNPICGISGEPVHAKDSIGRDINFYRLYFSFKLTEPLNYVDGIEEPNPEKQDKIYIMLSQSAPDTNTAKTSVYFDGIKLEKKLFENQDRPTTYHQGTTLVSPSNNLDVSGKHKHYEW